MQPPSDPEWLLIDILETVGEARDQDIADLPPINDAVDPEALEQLLTDATVPMTVGFDAYGYRVTVDSDGDVTVTKTET